jgi:glycosyltransferase involved in cell wall biosynthesis
MNPNEQTSTDADQLLKVAIVLPHFSGGGAERVLLQVARGLDLKRFATTVVVLDGQGPYSKLIPSHVSVRDLSTPQLRAAFGSLRQTFREMRPDVVLSTLGYLNLGVLAASFGTLSSRCRLIVREANIPQATATALGSNLLTRLAYTILYRRADAVLCNAKIVKEELVRFGVQKKRIHVVANPIDTDGIRGSIKWPIRSQDKEIRFVAMGRLVHQKGFDRLINWIAELNKPAHLIILGEGPMRPELEEQIINANLGDRVTLRGHVEVPWQHLAEADAFLLSSRWEGMPNAALEALALGVPVIACNEAGGVVELPDETPEGAVVIADTSKAFVAAMKQVTPRARTTDVPCSLLPERYGLRAVLKKYETLISGNA